MSIGVVLNARFLGVYTVHTQCTPVRYHYASPSLKNHSLRIFSAVQLDEVVCPKFLQVKNSCNNYELTVSYEIISAFEMCFIIPIAYLQLLQSA